MYDRRLFCSTPRRHVAAAHRHFIVGTRRVKAPDFLVGITIPNRMEWLIPPILYPPWQMTYDPRDDFSRSIEEWLPPVDRPTGARSGAGRARLSRCASAFPRSGFVSTLTVCFYVTWPLRLAIPLDQFTHRHRNA